MISDIHGSDICAQKLNRNRTFFNRCTFFWTLDFKGKLLDNTYRMHMIDELYFVSTLSKQIQFESHNDAIHS